MRSSEVEGGAVAEEGCHSSATCCRDRAPSYRAKRHARATSTLERLRYTRLVYSRRSTAVVSWAVLCTSSGGWRTGLVCVNKTPSGME